MHVDSSTCKPSHFIYTFLMRFLRASLMLPASPLVDPPAQSAPSIGKAKAILHELYLFDLKLIVMQSHNRSPARRSPQARGPTEDSQQTVVACLYSMHMVLEFAALVGLSSATARSYPTALVAPESRSICQD